MARFSRALKAITSFVIKKLSRSESRSLGYAHWPEHKLFKNAAEIGKASVTQKKFSQAVRKEIEEAARKKALEDAAQQASETGRQQGLSPAGVDALRMAIMGQL